MPPYATSIMTSTEPSLKAEEEMEEPKASARERDLLTIIANRDKRIQELEKKLETQSAFVDAVLKLSDDFKGLQQQPTEAETETEPGQVKLKRRISWCPSVDQTQLERKNSFESALSSRRSTGLGAMATSMEINVDDILDDVDDLSVLSEEDSPRKLAAAAIRKPGPVDLDDMVDDDNLSVLSEDEASSPRKLAASSSTSASASEPELVMHPVIALTESTEDTEPDSDESEVDIDEAEEDRITQRAKDRRKSARRKEESSLIQDIIEGLRNDDDSVSV